ncbi:TLC domain-containing protein [Ditylenchus destructor]|uniref:TLC domain-containing protein n=1 Tax=Ditylenchus destructor TaxID=166010 RepID=A0AAD4RBF5_9BILA|nr:TLC domain-containing protein [Ditylenchus destructor]
MSSSHSWLWSSWFWLPEGTTWDAFKSNETIQYPQFRDLSYSILAGIILLAVRICFECFVYLPIGYYGGWMHRKQSLCTRMVDHIHQLIGYGSNTNKFRRVAETAWRFTFYTSIWVVGLCVLWDQPQLWDVNSSYRDWPNHHIPDKIWYYYIVETGFYWALLFSTFAFDVRRSDFWEMMLHHMVTIFLLSMSWTINFVRVGTLILISHDSADILLELGKLFRYARWSTSTTIVFVILFVCWTGTRLVYFPFWVIHSMLFEAPKFVQKSYRWENLLQRPMVPRLLMIMLCVLLILHLFWTFLLLKIAAKSLKSGVDDIREDSESEDDSDSKKRD